MKTLPSFTDPKLIAGFDYSEDAAVYELNEKESLVATLDFFTPIVDDPYLFGAIAAANSLSDVYAMGGHPKLALNIVGFPEDLPMEMLGEILRGGADKVREANALLVGGHSVKDKEPKYGLSVIGFVDNDRLLVNSKARVGDKLILTKALGTGIISTAIKRGVMTEEDAKETIFSMQYLNKYAIEALGDIRPHSATDITGFGLIGHLDEMMLACGHTAVLDFHAIPLLPRVEEMVEMAVVPGGTLGNKKFYECRTDIEDLSYEESLPLFDAQTSGGLILSVAAEDAEDVIKALQAKVETPVALIGEVIPKAHKRIIVRK